ncbi:hypothetical protein BH10PSE16_BH10PSE16_35410 [soil metagenome]
MLRNAQHGKSPIPFKKPNQIRFQPMRIMRHLLLI